MDRGSTKRFRSLVLARPHGGITVGLPFDPSGVWDDLDAYHVNGAVGGQTFRGVLTRDHDAWSL